MSNADPSDACFFFLVFFFFLDGSSTGSVLTFFFFFASFLTGTSCLIFFFIGEALASSLFFRFDPASCLTTPLFLAIKPSHNARTLSAQLLTVSSCASCNRFTDLPIPLAMISPTCSLSPALCNLFRYFTLASAPSAASSLFLSFF